MKEYNEIMKRCVDKVFPDRKWIDDSIVGNSVEKAFRLAWEYGHSNGESEVYCYFVDLCSLIKPLID